MKKTGKDDFVSGFVPNHNHGSVDYTSVEGGHVHQCLDVTSPPIPTEDGSHIHYIGGYVLYEDGHTHYYRAYSGPVIPVGNGVHVHYYDFYTSGDAGHRHRVTDVDKPALGTK
ncbi:3D (Asp-Asp-Asp) domain-containing protein [Anoxybacillus tepidamans]|uniref:3D (Asp-Asp-Asp) domain-containing protein n=1 Tax=Anoxybacteroides tepidamans TaxID=265948 RepID=A0A7W8IM21_9BACL|nr:YmaF family protein [Anoxybacillus tepidamans]MBB5323076.1 3D (Asp-Asp-Asp) domain-containing protein [Anoxybacillus tepidamans]